MDLSNDELDHLNKILKNDKQFTDVCLSTAFMVLFGIALIAFSITVKSIYSFMMQNMGGIVILLAVFNLRDAIYDRKTARILEKLSPDVIDKIDLRQR